MSQPLAAASGSSRKNQNHWSTTASMRQGPSMGLRALRASSSARRRRWRSGSTTLAESARPPSTTPISKAMRTSTPSAIGTWAKPRSSTARCGLSAPTTMPATRQARATMSRRGRIIRRCGSFAGRGIIVRGRDRQLSRGSGIRFHGNDAADAFAEFLARLEMRYVLARQRDGIARLGIAAKPRRPVMQREAAEAADFDALAPGQRGAHHFEQGLHREIDVVRLQVALARGKDLDQFGLGHAGRLVGRLRDVHNYEYGVCCVVA